MIIFLPDPQHVADSKQAADQEGGTVGGWVRSKLVTLTPPLHHEPLHDLLIHIKVIFNSLSTKN